MLRKITKYVVTKSLSVAKGKITRFVSLKYKGI